MLSEINTDSLITMVRDAGNCTMRYFENKNNKTEFKSDSSPVTEADRAANDFICSYLKSNFPAIPIISEENESIPFSERKTWKKYWMVDPLDGTKEFIAGIPEFTVNVALIENGVPVIGVVGIPGEQTVYFGQKGIGAFIDKPGKKRTKISVRKTNANAPVFVISRSHGSGESESVKKAFPTASLMQVGSSLKFLKIAEGSADIYFRHQGICEWDTAAGHGVLLWSGGKMIDHSGCEIMYGNDTLRVNPFIALGEVDFPWKKLL